jgi:hypothetical protein
LKDEAEKARSRAVGSRDKTSKKGEPEHVESRALRRRRVFVRGAIRSGGTFEAASWSGDLDSIPRRAWTRYDEGNQLIN